MNYAAFVDYTRYYARITSYMLEHDDKEPRYYIPEKVLEFFDNEFDYRETANCEKLTTSILHFLSELQEVRHQLRRAVVVIVLLPTTTGAATKMMMISIGRVAVQKWL